VINPTDAMSQITIQNNVAKHRFETTVDGHLNLLDYQQHSGVLVLVHTEVSPELQGRGIAGKLVQAALDYARANKLKVDPQCEYAAAYMQRRPETHDLRA
jgi:predicted GNAT family acetyltransferase